jgi:monofunctional glycosyltransferase
MDPHRPRIAPTLTPRVERAAPPAAPPPPVGDPPRPRRSWVGRALLWLWLLLALLLLALLPPAAVLWLRWNPPPTTAFMRQSEVQPVAYHWVPAAQIPEALRRAVVAAEDQKFWTHWGFDFIAIAEALEHNEKSRRPRGASTITQQTAKNLFLWPSRSWLRKGLEATFTLLLEGLWTKDRILEVYLNIAEFGPGIYGAEAAARRFFGKPAALMTAAECARLAAVLPSPRKWRADRPGPYVQSRVDWILVQIGERPPSPGVAAEQSMEPPPEDEGADAPATDAAPAPEPATQAPEEPATDEALEEPDPAADAADAAAGADGTAATAGELPPDPADPADPAEPAEPAEPEPRPAGP